MDYIFEHEKLRADELMKRVSAKNNFTPLKPLRRIDFSMRKSTHDPHQKGMKSNKRPPGSVNRPQLRKELLSVSPILPESIRSASYKGRNETLYIIRYNKADTSRKMFSNSVKPLGTDRNESNTTLPMINKSPNLVEEKAFLTKSDNLRKNSQSLIAYIPSVSFVKDADENDSQKITKTIPHVKEVKSFLQNRRYVRKSL